MATPKEKLNKNCLLKKKKALIVIEGSFQAWALNLPKPVCATLYSMYKLCLMNANTAIKVSQKKSYHKQNNLKTFIHKEV